MLILITLFCCFQYHFKEILCVQDILLQVLFNSLTDVDVSVITVNDFFPVDLEAFVILRFKLCAFIEFG